MDVHKDDGPQFWEEPLATTMFGKGNWEVRRADLTGLVDRVTRGPGGT